MKVRTGFVSNSSSSSFILAHDKSKKIDKKFFLDLIGGSNIDNPIAKKLFDMIGNEMSRAYRDSEDRFGDIESYEDEFDKSSSRVKNAFKKDWEVIALWFSSDDVEDVMVYNLINEMGKHHIETDTFLVEFNR